MKIGVPKEIHAGEQRVATTPDVASQLIKLGFSVAIEQSAGAAASYSDEAYAEAGCELIDSASELWSQSDVILKVRAPEGGEENLLRADQTLISFLAPGQNPELLKTLTESGGTAMSMDSVPRISRAQKMDALSSMANIAGYRAIVEAAQHFGRFFTGQITAAGKIPPAKVLVHPSARRRRPSRNCRPRHRHHPPPPPRSRRRWRPIRRTEPSPRRRRP